MAERLPIQGIVDMRDDPRYRERVFRLLLEDFQDICKAMRELERKNLKFLAEKGGWSDIDELIEVADQRHIPVRGLLGWHGKEEVQS